MNTDQIPPGGWVYYQAQTGWHAPFPVGMTFTQQVNNIIKHRRANPAIVAKHNLATDPAQVGQELIAFQQARGALPPSPKMTAPAASPSLPHLSGLVVAGIEVVKRMAAGMATLLEWQETGQAPVASELSAKRAKICESCPKNDMEGMTKYFTGIVANNIRNRLSKLHEMNLTTPSDAKLGVCSACLCNLRLKCHTPLDLVLKRLKPETKVLLDQRCWILKQDA